MPTLNEIRDMIDTRLTALWPHIVARQTTFFANRGKYFQGVVTPAQLPADGEERAPDLALHPHDQAQTWANANFNLGATLPMRLALDTYSGPHAAGWIARVWVRVAGRTWTRARGVGPHADEYTHSWREVVA